MAGHRAIAAAERSEDAVIMAPAARHLADAMTNHGQAATAVAFVTAAARRLEPDLLQRGPEGLSVLGMLFLVAVVVAVDDEGETVPLRHVPRGGGHPQVDIDRGSRAGGGERVGGMAHQPGHTQGVHVIQIGREGGLGRSGGHAGPYPG